MVSGSCSPNTLARLDTVLEIVYVYDNHSRVQPIEAYDSARDFGEDLHFDLLTARSSCLPGLLNF
jgi:hypothetical protein